VGKLGLTRPAGVRAARASDLDAIVALEAECFAPADRFPRRAWRRLLSPTCRGSARIWLAERDGGVLGSICWLLRAGSGVARMYSLAVSPRARGRGLGRLLVTASAARLPARVATLALEVRADNAAALALYCGLGFVETQRLPEYYDAPEGGGALGLRLRCARAALPPLLPLRGPIP